MNKLLIFVKDFMHLPEALEQEFEAEDASLSNFLNPHNTMNRTRTIPYHREGTIKIMSDFLFQMTGKTGDDFNAELDAMEATKRELNAALRKAKQVETQFKTQLKRAETLRVQAEKKIEAERAERVKAEAERVKAEAERVKAEADTIFNLHSKAGLSMETIATTLNLELEYVKKTIDPRLEK